MAGQFANLELGHVAQREDRATQLLLREAEEEVRLVLARVGRTLEQPAASSVVEGHARVVSGGNALSPNLLGHNE